MKKTILLFFAGLFLFTSCLTRQKVPEHILGKEIMVELLIDVHLSSAIFAQRYRLDLPRKNFSEDLYLSVCEKHSIDPERFAESVYYYGKNPKFYQEIYDEVLNRLNELEETTKNEEEKFQP